MHPSRAIRARRSRLLEGRRIVLGVTGSIAAVEAPRIARELIRHGADVRAVMTRDASRLITPDALRFATGHPPVTELTGDVEHVALLGPGPERADLLLIAPATANSISKIAHGIDDTPVASFATIALGGGVPVLLAPAMHAQMEQNPAIRENLARLRQFGVEILGPREEEGEAKLPTPESIAAAVLHRLARSPLVGRRVLVIGGASREPIDSVRSVTNESTGRTAVALAEAAFFRGADVVFWSGALQVPVPEYLPTVPWGRVEELRALVRSRASELAAVDLVLVPAALSDFTLVARPGKISSREHPELSITLTRAPKILPELRRRVPRTALLVGFKLEAGGSASELARAAEELLREGGLDVVVANDRSTLGSPNAAALVLSRDGPRHWLEGPKADVAGKLLDDLGRALAARITAPRPPDGAGGTRHRTRSRRPPRSRPRSR
ncbi:MAG TPA: bifunctional phosphopantothenoylcysteine decarboxylase/phosphopantothenate--cysteine ligase CoaBC [Thermoplasmata archaeon]|nr:bifunctional phosphopantothenoylcysteine decarboxylase/phosphopantothenate--cysteine ligase CoaBC [Thermoplasmata archaeon]